MPPMRKRRGGFLKVFAAFVVRLAVQRVAIDILGNVFSNVTRCAAFLRVDSLGVKTGLAGLVGRKLVAVFLPGVVAHNLAHALSLFRAHKHQHVPVWGRVVMRLGNTDSEDADFFAMQLGANFLPYTAEITLRVGRAGTVPFSVTMPGFDCGVIARGGGQRVELADKAHLVADVFEAANAGHQLAAGNRRIGHAAVVFLDQADAVAFFVFQLHSLQKLTGAALLLTPLRYGHAAGIGGMLFADVCQSDLEMFTPSCGDATQPAFPPIFHLHTQDCRSNFLRVKKARCDLFPQWRRLAQLAGDGGGGHVNTVRVFVI